MAKKKFNKAEINQAILAIVGYGMTDERNNLEALIYDYDNGKFFEGLEDMSNDEFYEFAKANYDEPHIWFDFYVLLNS